MSNIIKASAINYRNDVRPLDMNGKAEEIANKYMNDFYTGNVVTQHQLNFDEVSRKLEDQGIVTQEDMDFTPGLFGEQIETPLDEDSYASEAASLEMRLSEKKAEIAQAEAAIEEARQEAERILAEARENAEEILEEARRNAEEESVNIKEDARQAGYADGMDQAGEQIEQIRAEADAKKEEYRAEYEKQVEEMEPAFVELIIKYVAKLTGFYSEDKQEIILHLIDDAFKGQKGTENFIIRVSEADYPIVAYSKEVIKGYISDDSSLEIVADKMLQKSQCLIETESRIYDCSLDEKLNALIEDIRLLAEKD